MSLNSASRMPIPCRTREMATMQNPKGEACGFRRLQRSRRRIGVDWCANPFGAFLSSVSQSEDLNHIHLPRPDALTLVGVTKPLIQPLLKGSMLEAFRGEILGFLRGCIDRREARVDARAGTAAPNSRSHKRCPPRSILEGASQRRQTGVKRVCCFWMFFEQQWLTLRFTASGAVGTPILKRNESSSRARVW